MNTSLQFVHVGTASDGQQGALSTVDQRAIRSQAMKDFRRRQREARKTLFQSSLVSANTQDSAQVPDDCPPGTQGPTKDSKTLQWIDLSHVYHEGPNKLCHPLLKANQVPLRRCPASSVALVAIHQDSLTRSTTAVMIARAKNSFYHEEYRQTRFRR